MIRTGEVLPFLVSTASLLMEQPPEVPAASAMSPVERVHAPLEQLIERLAVEQKAAYQEAVDLRRPGILLHDFDTAWD
eukprot:7520283-Lingulodinium_polyedra.AAC.1